MPSLAPSKASLASCAISHRPAQPDDLLAQVGDQRLPESQPPAGIVPRIRLAATAV